MAFSPERRFRRPDRGAAPKSDGTPSSGRTGPFSLSEVQWHRVIPEGSGDLTHELSSDSLSLLRRKSGLCSSRGSLLASAVSSGEGSHLPDVPLSAEFKFPFPPPS